MIEADRPMTIRATAEKLNIFKTTVSDLIKRIGFIKNAHIWIADDSKGIYLTQHINMRNMLLRGNQNDPYPKRIVIGDKNWVLYKNKQHNRSWSKNGEPSPTTPKLDIYGKRILL